jgi:ketosteroid isomerase-like protein
MVDSQHDAMSDEYCIDRIRLYYILVDSDQLEPLVDLFAEEAVYHRPGYPPLLGRARLRRFYQQERIIKAGRHEVTRILAVDGVAAVHGAFDGVLTDGSKVSLRFADFFELRPGDRRFVRRDTFFFAPMV